MYALADISSPCCVDKGSTECRSSARHKVEHSPVLTTAVSITSCLAVFQENHQDPSSPNDVCNTTLVCTVDERKTGPEVTSIVSPFCDFFEKKARGCQALAVTSTAGYHVASSTAFTEGKIG